MYAQNLPIDQIEAAYGVKILLIFEAGSKAWGVASEYSDQDLGLVYCRPLNWYLSVSEKPDTIPLLQHTDYDGSGWDILKTLRLLLRSNAVLFDWLQATVLHEAYPGLKSDLYAFAQQCFDARKVIYHYLGMGNNLIHKYKTKEEIPIKTYLLLVRSTLAAMWIMQRGEAPPVLFSELLQIAESQPKALLPIHQLVMLKKQAKPDKETNKISIVDQFISDNRRICMDFAEALPSKDRSLEKEADELFRKWILDDQLLKVR